VVKIIWVELDTTFIVYQIDCFVIKLPKFEPLTGIGTRTLESGSVIAGQTTH
jgi:hypothetical protein